MCAEVGATPEGGIRWLFWLKKAGGEDVFASESCRVPYYGI